MAEEGGPRRLLPGRWWPAAVTPLAAEDDVGGGAPGNRPDPVQMDQWLTRLPRWHHKTDFKPDDETEEGRLRNHRFVRRMIDSHIDEVRAQLGAQLSGEEVLDVNAHYYRFEMLHRSAPSALAVDCTIDYREDELRDTIVCESTEMRAHRCAFSFDFQTDGMAQLLKEYDEKVDSMRRSSSTSLVSDPLPRDWSINTKQLFGRARVSKWRSPNVQPYKEGVYGATEPFRGCLNQLPTTTMKDPVRDSTLEARSRLVATLCWFRRHQRYLLAGVIMAMRQRAARSAALYEIADRMRVAARLVAQERQSAPDALTRIVRDRAGEELGEALWPYLPPEEGCPLMATCKSLHQWGVRFQRRLLLRIHGDSDSDVDQEEDDLHVFRPHKVEADGSLTMLKNRRIFLQPILQHRFLTHRTNPPGHDPPYLLREETHLHLKHGTALDTDRSCVRAFLVFDDEQRTEVPCFGKAALRRWDGGDFIVGPNYDQTYSHFPKGRLPRVIVSPNRLSSDFGKHKDTRFRIVVEVSLVTKGAPEDVISEVVHVTETPPFRVVARLESEQAAAASKARYANWKHAGAWHLSLVRDHQPSTAADLRDQNYDPYSDFDAIDFLNDDALNESTH